MLPLHGDVEAGSASSSGELVFSTRCIDARSVYHCLKCIEEREGDTRICEKQSITQISCKHLQSSTM